MNIPLELPTYLAGLKDGQNTIDFPGEIAGYLRPYLYEYALAVEQTGQNFGAAAGLWPIRLNPDGGGIEVFKHTRLAEETAGMKTSFVAYITAILGNEAYCLQALDKPFLLDNKQGQYLRTLISQRELGYSVTSRPSDLPGIKTYSVTNKKQATGKLISDKFKARESFTIPLNSNENTLNSLRGMLSMNSKATNVEYKSHVEGGVLYVEILPEVINYPEHVKRLYSAIEKGETLDKETAKQLVEKITADTTKYLQLINKPKKGGGLFDN